MEPQVKENMSNTNTWGRGLFMLLFAVIQWISKTVLVIAIIIQFGFVLITGEKNVRILTFSKELSKFLYEIFMYLTFNTETKPFPFDPWPESDSTSLTVDSTDSAESAESTESTESTESADSGDKPGSS